MSRPDGRKNDELRPLEFVRGYLPHAEGSCLVKMGNTWVVCTATVEDRVPAWLKGSGRGWITAEYAMLPRATETRTSREASQGRVGGRTHEIQRIIGRSLRSVVDRTLFPDKTVWLDCDVIRADGGTRMAAVNGAFIALYDALAGLRDKKVVSEMPLGAFLAGVSVGIIDGEILTDLAYREDSAAQVDLNLVMTDAGRIIEVQGTAERQPFTKAELDLMLAAAEAGIEQVIAVQRTALYERLSGG
ncbi:MAG: ribonuclease PH [Chloroflexi bacterium]|nr:ribonuclease PH [Chloroflexota bacterium]